MAETFNTHTQAEIDEMFVFDDEDTQSIEEPVEADKIDLVEALDGSLGEDAKKQAEAYIASMVEPEKEAQTKAPKNLVAINGGANGKKKTKKEIEMEQAVANAKRLKTKPDWYQDLKFKFGKNRKGEYDALIDTMSIQNLVQIINNDDVTKGKFALNAFNRKVEIVEPVKLVGKTYQCGPIKNLLFNRLARHLDIKYDVLIPENRSAEALMQAAEENEYNPIVNYVEACKRVYQANPGEYIDDFFPKTLGAEKTEAVVLSTHILLNEMVMKAFDPYAKAEFSIDTIGSQGVGKTRVFEALFSTYSEADVNKTIHEAKRESYFLNNVSAIKDKDAQLKISQNWGFIDDELEATRKSSFEEMKALLSTTFFEIRGAYQREAEVVPRSAVIVRTTNENDYLKDKSGQRRFLPILSNKDNKDKDISELFVGDIMAMIGQAVVEYENGFNSNMLEADKLALFEDSRKDFTYETAIDNIIEEYLQILIPATWAEWLPQMKQEYIQDQLDGINRKIYRGILDTSMISFSVENLVRREYVQAKDVLFEALKEPVSSRSASKVKYALEHNSMVSNEKRFVVNGKTIRGFKFVI